MDKLYTAKELSAIFKVSTDTIWRWGRERKIKTVKIGRTVRYLMPKEGADEWKLE